MEVRVYCSICTKRGANNGLHEQCSRLWDVLGLDTQMITLLTIWSYWKDFVVLKAKPLGTNESQRST